MYLKQTYFIEDLRNLSATVYAFILLVIGIPLWWRMTEVQRHPLPYSHISQLGSMDVEIAMDIFVFTNNPSETKRIIEQLQITFNSSKSINRCIKCITYDKLIKIHFTAMFRVNAQPSTYINQDNTLNTLESINPSLGSLQLIETKNVDYIIAGLGRNVYFPPNTSKPLFYYFIFILLFLFLSCVFNVNIKYFLDIQSLMDALKRLTQIDALSDSMISMLNPGEHSEDAQVVAERQCRVRPSSDYNVLLTVVNPEPDKLKVSWAPEIPLNSESSLNIYFALKV